MKKVCLFIAVLCLPMTPIVDSYANHDGSEAIHASAASMRDVLLHEADYEPNDWTKDDPFPPVPWSGDIGTLPTGESVSLNGTLDSTGLSGDWYAGDTDLFGFSLPEGGILEIDVEFDPDCDEDNFYNVWIYSLGDDGFLYLLDVNFAYIFFLPVICPYTGIFPLEPFGEAAPGVQFTNDFFLYVAAAGGVSTTYTVSWRFTPCADADGDGFLDTTCGGTDCDDSSPAVNPCNPELPAACGDGIDQDCTGIQGTVGGPLFPAPDNDLRCGGLQEVEPNDDLTAGEVHDLGVFDEGLLTLHGDLASVGYDIGTGYIGDDDYYRFLMPSPGYLFFQMMSDCRSDFDLYWLGYYDPDGEATTFDLDWYVIGFDASIHVPETLGGVLVEERGWEFPLTLAIHVVGYGGDPGYYSLELLHHSACLDVDGDGYGAGPDPIFEAIHGYAGICDEDCDDADPMTNPGAFEICDTGTDEDCDGTIDEPDCAPGPVFTLDLDLTYDAGTLVLDFTIGTPEEATWANFLIVTQPSLTVVPLWSVPLPVILPAVQYPVSFPLPDLGWVGFYSGLFTQQGAEVIESAWVNTGSSRELGKEVIAPR